MKSRCMLRLLSVLLALCLMTPAFALAEESTESLLLLPLQVETEAEVTDDAENGYPEIAPDPAQAELWPVPAKDALEADYQLRLLLDTEALPHNPDFHAADWAKLLDKLSLSGNLKCYNFPFAENYFYHEGSLNLNGNPALALHVDSNETFRYIRSNAWKGENILFQMHNFFEFMTKFSYYGFNAKYISLMMYPEATLYLADEYQNVLAPYLWGEGSRSVSYDQLKAMCLELNQIALNEDDSNQLLRYLNNLLSEMRVNYAAYEQLSQTDVYLDFLDPEKQGMTITVEDGVETYVIGGRTVFQRRWDDASSSFDLTLPDQNGCQLNVHYASTNDGTLELTITTLSEGEVTMDVGLTAAGLPVEGQLSAQGTAQVSFGGEYISEETQVYDFQFSLEHSSAEYPRHTDFTLGWVNPETGKPALSVLLSADCQLLATADLTPPETFEMPDFFRLNEGVISEYVDMYGKSAVATLLPLALEIPSGVINDVITIIQKYEVLETLGIF